MAGAADGGFARGGYRRTGIGCCVGRDGRAPADHSRCHWRAATGRRRAGMAPRRRSNEPHNHPNRTPAANRDRQRVRLAAAGVGRYREPHSERARYRVDRGEGCVRRFLGRLGRSRPAPDDGPRPDRRRCRLATRVGAPQHAAARTPRAGAVRGATSSWAAAGSAGPPAERRARARLAVGSFLIGPIAPDPGWQARSCPGRVAPGR